jgi:hypothetical protein
MEDYGLISGLASGLKSGLSAYKEEKKRQQDKEKIEEDRKLKKLIYKLSLKEKGLLETPEGGFIEDETNPFVQERKTKGLLENKKTEAEIEKLQADARKARSLSAGEIDEVKFKSLPKDKQVGIERISGKKADVLYIRSQMDQLLSQLDDPTITKDQKLQAAQNAAKLINSPLGADAVGEGEAKRVLAYLDAWPQPFGPKGLIVGPDLPGFTKSLSLQRDRLKNTESQMQKEVDSMFGRTREEFPRVLRKGNKQVTVSNSQEMKEANAEGWR